jgi:hypothetical protein
MNDKKEYTQALRLSLLAVLFTPAHGSSLH